MKLPNRDVEMIAEAYSTIGKRYGQTPPRNPPYKTVAKGDPDYSPAKLRAPEEAAPKANVLDKIIDDHAKCVAEFRVSGELSEDLYAALYDYYMDNNEIPYGIAKARTGDPYEWVSDRFERELQDLGY